MTKRTWRSQHQPGFRHTSWMTAGSGKSQRKCQLIENSLKPYTSQMDKFHHIFENVQKLEENMQQYEAKCRICRSHIMAYSSYSSYCNMQNMQNMNSELLFCILFCIFSICICILMHIFKHILHILHIAICWICRIWTVH